MIEPMILYDVSQRSAGTGFGIGRTENQPFQTGKNHSAGAHRAGFERNVKAAVF
jgi:hypothetical protein